MKKYLLIMSLYGSSLTACCGSSVEKFEEKSIWFTYAAQGNVKEMRQMLNDGTVQVSCIDKVGNTALHIAVVERQHRVIEFLLDNCIDINIQNNDLYAALHLALQQEDDDIATLLIKRAIIVKEGRPKLAINIQDQSGLTIVHRLIKRNAVKLLKILIDFDFHLDLTVRGKKGPTPVDLIQTKEMLNLLAEKLAKIDPNKIPHIQEKIKIAARQRVQRPPNQQQAAAVPARKLVSYSNIVGGRI